MHIGERHHSASRSGCRAIRRARGKKCEVGSFAAHLLYFSDTSCPPFIADPPVLRDGHRQAREGLRPFRVDVERGRGSSRHRADLLFRGGCVCLKMKMRRTPWCMHTTPSITTINSDACLPAAAPTFGYLCLQMGTNSGGGEGDELRGGVGTPCRGWYGPMAAMAIMVGVGVVIHTLFYEVRNFGWP